MSCNLCSKTSYLATADAMSAPGGTSLPSIDSENGRYNEANTHRHQNETRHSRQKQMVGQSAPRGVLLQPEEDSPNSRESIGLTRGTQRRHDTDDDEKNSAPNKDQRRDNNGYHEPEPPPWVS